MNDMPFGFGAKPRTKSPIDYHADSFASATPTPVSYSTPVSVIYMQNKQPCCGADMATEYLNILFGFTGSPEFTWKNMRHIDGLGANDGSESITGAKASKNVGTCALVLFPDNSLDTPANYASYAGVTTSLLNNASTRRIANYAFIDNPTMQQIKDNIYTHKAVGLRVACGDNWWKNGWGAAQTVPITLGNYVDDHFILATGFDDKGIQFCNSWSSAWGNNGMSYFDESYIKNVRELIIYIPPVTPVTPTPATYTFTTDFGIGTTSADVHSLQVKLGMPASLCTGYFGVITWGYVRLYQFRRGIPETGFVGPLTRSSLNSS